MHSDFSSPSAVSAVSVMPTALLGSAQSTELPGVSGHTTSIHY